MPTYYYDSDRKWWEQQWLDLLSSYRFKKRLERGRYYAADGNVLSIDFKDQKVVSKVRGTASEPYEQTLWLDPFTDEDWSYAIETMSERAIFSAKLLAGEMPENIEDVFAPNGLRLFPFTLSDIHSRCSCPDKANPCKHIAAVYYLLGERFSEDPFLLFQLRGRTKEQIITALREKRGIEKSGETDKEKSTESPPQKNRDPIDISGFWKYSQQLESGLAVIAPPPSSETVLEVLGPIGSVVVMEYLDDIYKKASQQAMIAGLNREE